LGTTLLTLALACLAAVFFWLHLASQEKWQSVAAQNASLIAALESRRTIAAEQAAGVRQMFDVEQKMLRSRYADLLAAVEWGVNQSATYPYGELPLGADRLAILDELVQRLESIGFAGIIRLESHVGNFCLVSGANGQMEIAADGLSVGQCASVGLEPEEARARSAKQTIAFANYIGAAARRERSPIKVEVLPLGNSRPLYAYPPRLVGTLAGEWNRIAAQNNRGHIRLLLDH
jgi:hypothetical protein